MYTHTSRQSTPSKPTVQTGCNSSSHMHTHPWASMKTSILTIWICVVKISNNSSAGLCNTHWSSQRLQPTSEPLVLKRPSFSFTFAMYWDAIQCTIVINHCIMSLPGKELDRKRDNTHTHIYCTSSWESYTVPLQLCNCTLILYHACTKFCCHGNKWP